MLSLNKPWVGQPRARSFCLLYPFFRTALVAVVFLDCTACLDKDRVEGGRFALSEEGMREGGSAHGGLV